jgi:hypothetical protein
MKNTDFHILHETRIQSQNLGCRAPFHIAK